MSYLRAAQQAAQSKRGLFTYPDEAHLLLLPWKFRSGIVHMNSYVLNSEHSIAVAVDKLTYACKKINSSKSVCCIKHMKERETLLEVKPSAIVGAGMGVFVKKSKRIEKERLLCTYSDLPVTSENGIDPDYHFEVFSGPKSTHYDGFRVKHFQLGPLVNDISFTCFVKAVEEAVKLKDKSMLEYVFSHTSEFRNRCNSSVRMLKTSLVLVTTKPIHGNYFSLWCKPSVNCCL